MSFKNSVFGKSTADEAEDEAMRKTHAIQVQKMKDQAMASAREQRGY